MEELKNIEDSYNEFVEQADKFIEKWYVKTVIKEFEKLNGKSGKGVDNIE